MIKGIVLDVDGVLIGNIEGFNWPLPNDKVIDTLKSLNKKGIFVSLCTGKGTFAIKKLVELARLDGFHSGDGGAVVTNILQNKIIAKHTISKEIAQKVIDKYQNQNTYLEIYTTDGYYVQKNTVCDITNKHGAILYQKPIFVNSLKELTEEEDVIKIMPVARDDQDKIRIINNFKEFEKGLSLQWGVHPTATPLHFGIITNKGISKGNAVEMIAMKMKVPLEQILGVGDGMTDWGFMKLCGYAGAMGNSTDDLKEVVKKSENGYVGKSVDENGVLDIFEHFGLI